MKKIRLKNGNTYAIESGATEYICSMVFSTLTDAVPVIEDFTEANLEKVEFLDASGEVCKSCSDRKLVNNLIEKLNDGTHRVIFHMGVVLPSADEILNILLGGAEL